VRAFPGRRSLARNCLGDMYHAKRKYPGAVLAVTPRSRAL